MKGEMVMETFMLLATLSSKVDNRHVSSTVQESRKENGKGNIF